MHGFVLNIYMSRRCMREEEMRVCSSLLILVVNQMFWSNLHPPFHLHKIRDATIQWLPCVKRGKTFKKNSLHRTIETVWKRRYPVRHLI